MLLFLAILVCAALAAEEKLYPDLSCHKGYNNDTKGEMGTANDYIRHNMHNCKKDEKEFPCFKSCIMNSVGILQSEWNAVDMVLQDEEYIWHSMANTAFKDYDAPAARTIAKKIVSSCTDLAKKVRKLPCSQRTDFFACVEKAWAC